jgi:hypothetical protein
MTMRNLFAFLTSFACFCALLTLVPAASAQSGDAAAKLQALSQELKLTPQQKTELLPILKVEVPKIEGIKNSSSLTGLQKLKQLRAIHNESAPQMQKILSPAQYEQLQKIRQQEIEQAMAQKRGGS